MSWTLPQDVIDSWVGTHPPSDTDALQLWINRAERKIRRDVPDIVARLAAAEADSTVEPDLRDTITDVVTEMVERKFRNPEGVRTAQDTTGPMSGSVTYGGDHPGVLYLTADNLADLAPPEKSRSKAFSIDLMPERPEQHALTHSWMNGPDYLAPEDTL